MQPVRRVMNATHFKQVFETGEDGATHTRYMPCSPGDPDAREMTWVDVESDQLKEVCHMHPRSHGPAATCDERLSTRFAHRSTNSVVE